MYVDGGVSAPFCDYPCGPSWAGNAPSETSSAGTSGCPEWADDAQSETSSAGTPEPDNDAHFNQPEQFGTEQKCFEFG